MSTDDVLPQFLSAVAHISGRVIHLATNRSYFFRKGLLHLQTNRLPLNQRQLLARTRFDQELAPTFFNHCMVDEHNRQINPHAFPRLIVLDKFW